MHRLSQHTFRYGLTVAAAATLPTSLLLTTGRATNPGPRLPHIQPLRHRAYAQKIPGSNISFDMVPIPGGEYLMGSPASEPGRKSDEGPQHPVKILPFWMGKCPVTWDEYDLYWQQHSDAKKVKKSTAEDKAADAVTRPSPPYVDETFGHGRKHRPVLCISHHAAMQYCRWLSLKTGKTYRLPTEAEWEWAARAGTTTAYFFGSDPKKLGDYAWYDANSGDDTHDVGTKKPNPWGLHDIYGNVAQWCLDYYDKYAYTQARRDKITLEPVVLPGNMRFSHVTRGGSWCDPASTCRSAARRGSDKSWLKQDPDRPQSIWWLTDADFVGFRVVRPVAELRKLKGLVSTVTKQSE